MLGFKKKPLGDRLSLAVDMRRGERGGGRCVATNSGI